MIINIKTIYIKPSDRLGLVRTSLTYNQLYLNEPAVRTHFACLAGIKKNLF